MLVVDVSASGNYGSVSLSKRELAAEVASILAFSAIRNNDKVGLILFSDHVELFITPKKGRIISCALSAISSFSSHAGGAPIPPPRWIT